MKNLKGSIVIAIITFLIAVMVTLSSQTRIKFVTLPVAITILFFIIFIGIFADMIGVAATVARREALNAKAAKKIFGAKQGLFLVKHGDRVASFMCDIVGDICGTVSGAIGAAVVIRIIQNLGGSITLINLLIIGFISALTVGGKAFFKRYGIKKSNEIILSVGKFIAFFGFLRVSSKR